MKDYCIYISGKVTGTTDYIERFTAAEEKLIKAGYEVINPVKECQELGLTEWHDCMNHCLKRLKEARLIYMMQGWQDSKGAIAEITQAINDKMRILFEE